MQTANEVMLDRLLQVAALLGDDSDRSLAALGLTRSRAHLLWVVAVGGPQPQHALAADGHVERRPHPSDRRAVLVALTADGERMMRMMQRDHAALADALVEGLPAADRAALDGALAHVVARLQHLIEDAS